MVGNIVTGCTVMAPAGMLPELASGLGVSILDAGLLITYGAIVLCVGSPLSAWLTSRIERRTLLTVTLAVMAVGNAASAVAPDYVTLLVIRLVMLAVGALYTPQAAGTAALVSPAGKRGSTIAYVFLGWSVAAAVGLPLITFIASRYGWRAAHGGVAVLGFLGLLLLAWRLPAGLVGAPVSLKTWTELGRNRIVVLLLLITTLQMSGQFVVFTYMGPLVTALTQAGPDAVGLVFAVYGAFGFIGILIATRIVDVWGPFRSSLLFTVLVLVGVTVWTFSDGNLSADRLLGRDLGTGICLGQFDAAGEADHGGAGAGLGLGVAQYFGVVHRPGARFRARGRALCARYALRHRLCGHWPCCARAGGGAGVGRAVPGALEILNTADLRSSPLRRGLPAATLG